MYALEDPPTLARSAPSLLAWDAILALLSLDTSRKAAPPALLRHEHPPAAFTIPLLRPLIRAKLAIGTFIAARRFSGRLFAICGRRATTIEPFGGVTTTLHRRTEVNSRLQPRRDLRRIEAGVKVSRSGRRISSPPSDHRERVCRRVCSGTAEPVRSWRRRIHRPDETGRVVSAQDRAKPTRSRCRAHLEDHPPRKPATRNTTL